MPSVARDRIADIDDWGVVEDRHVVTVTDDGTVPIGIDGPVPGSGFGLIGMAERAEALAGSLTAGPLEPPQHGWRVHVALPLVREAAR